MGQRRRVPWAVLLDGWIGWSSVRSARHTDYDLGALDLILMAEDRGPLGLTRRGTNLDRVGAFE